ncbi:hypothetical protein [Aerosticca soli]|nr:hypothetical protein [Aerosticca soli]MDI3262785.1 hypothetical protein [Fulvimonas sp.]
MKDRRRLAWWTLVIALLVVLAVGTYQALHHEERRPVQSGAPAAP